MSRITYCNPKLYIDGKLIESLTSFNFSESMNNTLQSFNAQCSEPDLENIDLFGKKVEFYLNYGSEDGIPLFRGFIREFSTTDTSFSFSAQDPRVLITGNNAEPLYITDKDNYDGFTLSQFIYSYITTNINVNKVNIGLDYLNEIDKPVFMTGERHEGASPWSVITSVLDKAVDESNVEEPISYFLDIIHTNKNSDIIFRKRKSLEDSYAKTFKYNDGIIDLYYKERAPVSVAFAKSIDGASSKFEYGNTPKGRVGKNVSGDFKDAAEAQKAARNEVLLNYKDTKEISLQCNKKPIKLSDFI